MKSSYELMSDCCKVVQDKTDVNNKPGDPCMNCGLGTCHIVLITPISNEDWHKIQQNQIKPT